METSRIAELLAPFMTTGEFPALELSLDGLNKFKLYLDLLLRWNAKTNLTAVRDPEAMVTRHFGESLFLARVLLAKGVMANNGSAKPGISAFLAADLGSGAGFPGLPLKIACPWIHSTLIESQNKKITFLREVIRALALDGVEVYSGRGEALADQLAAPSAAEAHPRFDLVTFRAVERFADTLPLAARLLRAGGALGLLIGTAQREPAVAAHPELDWHIPLPLPGAREGIVQLAFLPTPTQTQTC